MHSKYTEKFLKLFLAFGLLNLFIFFYYSSEKSPQTAPINCNKNDLSNLEDQHEDLIDFENFDYLQGLTYEIIPDIIHLLYLNSPEIKFYQMVNIFSILFNHRPKAIYWHCDNCSFSGKYFDAIRNHKELWSLIKIHKIPFHSTIFGKEYGWINHHRSDIWRLQLLMNYGGIFLDNDVYVVNSLKEYRRYEMVVSWDQPFETRGLGVQVLIAHRNARLLKAHFDQYRVDYQSKRWYHNAGFVPAKILLKHPYLAHVVEYKLGTQDLVYELYGDHNQIYDRSAGILPPPNHDWDGWREFSTIHLLINHRSYLDEYSPITEFNETNIWTYNQAYGKMVRIILRQANVFVPGDQSNILD